MKNLKFKKLIFNVTNDLLNKGYKLNDFQMYVENHNNKIYLAAFSNSELSQNDYGSGDTEKYVATNKTTDFKEEIKRDGNDIAENGIFVNHKKIFNQLNKKESVSLCK